MPTIFALMVASDIAVAKLNAIGSDTQINTQEIEIKIINEAAAKAVFLYNSHKHQSYFFSSYSLLAIAFQSLFSCLSSQA
jgi:hypothetical protein